MLYKKGRFKGTAILASVGINLVVATFIGYLIGFYLDKYLGTEPWFTIIFLLVGITAGFKNLFTVTKKYGGFEEEEQGEDEKGDN